MNNLIIKLFFIGLMMNEFKNGSSLKTNKTSTNSSLSSETRLSRTTNLAYDYRLGCNSIVNPDTNIPVEFWTIKGSIKPRYSITYVGQYDCGEEDEWINFYLRFWNPHGVVTLDQDRGLLLDKSKEPLIINICVYYNDYIKPTERQVQEILSTFDTCLLGVML